MLQLKYKALTRRQSPQRTCNVGSQFLTQQLLLRIVDRLIVGDLREEVVNVGFDGAAFWAGPPSPEQVQADVGGNAIDPGRKGALEPEAIQLLINFQKSLLMDVLGIALGSGNPKRKSQNGLIVSADQLLKSDVIPALRRATSNICSI